MNVNEIMFIDRNDVEYNDYKEMIKTLSID
jgi:hypothetical protein